MKYFFVVYKERNGEYEYYYKAGRKIAEYEDIHEVMDEYLSNFYGVKAEKEDGGYYFNGGEVHVRLAYTQEIPEEDYNTLIRYL